jgi:hypothetical protein
VLTIAASGSAFSGQLAVHHGVSPFDVVRDAAGLVVVYEHGYACCGMLFLLRIGLGDLEQIAAEIARVGRRLGAAGGTVRSTDPRVAIRVLRKHFTASAELDCVGDQAGEQVLRFFISGHDRATSKAPG